MTSTRAEPDVVAHSSRRTLLLGLAGGALYYLAQPPVAWSWLAWIAPTPWILLIHDEQLQGRRPYRALWVAGIACWLATIQWIRLAHSANYAAWAFVASYLGLYLPAFVGLSRVAVHRIGLPAWLAAPVVWTGLEWLRARLLTGFLMASLAHTQVGSPVVIQIADLFGEYGVTFLIVLVAAVVAEWLPQRATGTSSRSGGHSKLAAAVVAVAAIATTLLYGGRQIDRNDQQTERSSPRIALIQSDMLADWKGDRRRDELVMQQQVDLTLAAVNNSRRPIDLIVWPETMYRQPLMISDQTNPPPPGLVHESNYTAAAKGLEEIARAAGTALMVGIDRVIVFRDDHDEESDGLGMRGYNAVVCVDRTGQLLGAYDKMHLMPFGEYVPLVDWIPFLSWITPITGQAQAGTTARAFEIGGVLYSPNICYETTLPQLIRRQVGELVRKQRAPDVLVNVTNDAWYWGSSELDMHLAASVLRAVEMRAPLVAAGNRGLSYCIDAAGRIANVTERDRPAALVVDVRLPTILGANEAPSVYAAWGDWLPLGCLICCIVFAGVGVRDRRRTAT